MQILNMHSKAEK